MVGAVPGAAARLSGFRTVGRQKRRASEGPRPPYFWRYRFILSLRLVLSEVM